MATTYTFETMSASDAAAFSTADGLFFVSTSVSAINVTENAGTPLQNPSFTLTAGSKSLTFGEAQLAAASAATPNHIAFLNGDHLYLGTSSATADTIAASSNNVGSHTEIWGFGGGDSLTGGLASDTIFGGAGDDHILGVSAAEATAGNPATASVSETDYLMGGDGVDTITGGAGNDHIYGNMLLNAAGADDGGDSIDAGAGNDYVNGNAGADSILGNDGNDRLFGGADNDIIGGGNGNDYLQGNKGEDNLAGGIGNDAIHGGADNDVLLGGAGNDQLFGDKGIDNLTGGIGYDQLTGGAGNDVFTFAAGDASFTNLHASSTVTDHGLTDTVLDFLNGSDKIAIGYVPAAAEVVHGAAGATFTDVGAAQDYAQSLLTVVHDVVGVTVGADTYLFYNGSGSALTIDSAIKFVGVTDAVFNGGTGSDFI